MQPLKSLSSLIYVTTWIVASFIMLNVLFGSLEKTAVLRWLPDGQTGVGFLTESKQRINSAEAAYSSGAVSTNRYLGAIVGISNVREGVSVGSLNRTLSQRWRFLGVAGAGAGAPSIAEQAKLLLQSKLRPDLIILGISPLHLLDPLVDPVRSRAIASRAPQPGTVQLIKNEVRQLLWLVGRRNDLRTWADRQLMDARSVFQSATGLDETKQDTRSPWRPMLRTLAENSPTNEVLDSGVLWARSFGAGSLMAYKDSILGPKVAGEIIRTFQTRGACVIIVMMPEHSRLRELAPTEIAALTEARLRKESGQPNLIVLNYRASITDNGFIDLVHLNGKGSEALTSHLSATIKDFSIEHPPLMNAKTLAANRQKSCTLTAQKSLY